MSPLCHLASCTVASLCDRMYSLWGLQEPPNMKQQCPWDDLLEKQAFVNVLHLIWVKNAFFHTSQEHTKNQSCSSYGRKLQFFISVKNAHSFFSHLQINHWYINIHGRFSKSSCANLANVCINNMQPIDC